MLSEKLKNYYVVTFTNLNDGFDYNILIEDKNLAAFLANFDKKEYKLGNVTGLGELYSDINDFLDKNDKMEIGVQPK
jgi:hypothetical protein